MAQLPTENMDQVWQSTMEEFSSLRELIPVNKNQFRTLLELMDVEIEGAEIDIVQALPAGAGKTWLINNQAIGRTLMIRIMQKRREVL